jgi:DNA-binding NarL/FixJ family response regulator
MSGVELLRTIKEENIGLPPTLVCSSLSADSYIMECLKLGASSYLIKPISALNLLNSISDCLALSMKKRTALAQPSVSLLDETPLTLTKAMMKVNASRQTGQIIVETADGVGILDYSSGKLSSARFKDLKGLHAPETLRSLPHRSVTIQVVE